MKCISRAPKARKWQNWDFEPRSAKSCADPPTSYQTARTPVLSASRLHDDESVSQVLAPEPGSLICYLVSADHGGPVEGRVPGEPSRTGIGAHSLIALLFHLSLILILFCFQDMHVHSLFPKGFLVGSTKSRM